MPEYTYLKRELEKEDQKKNDKHITFIETFYEEEELMIEYVMNRVREQIEADIKKYYKTSKKKSVSSIKRRFLSGVFTYSSRVLSGYKIECCDYAKTCMYVYGIDSYCWPQLRFPEEKYLDKFVNHLNQKFLSNNIIISYTRDQSNKNEFLFYVNAELGKL